MDNTKLLSGKLTLTSDTAGTASITMNDVTKDLPFTYVISGKEFQLKATMDISKWNAEKAVQALNVICKDLHKAADGISKTWDDVAINITTVFQ